MSAIQIQIHQISATTSEAEMGPHRVFVDPPVEKGAADKGPRVARTMTAAIVAGMLAAFGTLRLVSHHRIEVPPQAYPVLIFPVLMIVLVLAMIKLTTGAQMGIERATGEVSARLPIRVGDAPPTF